MLWLIDLTAASAATSGVNSWAAGILRGIGVLDAPDKWAVLGTARLPDSIRSAARSAGASVFISANHRGVAQQFELPYVANRIRADGILAATTVLPLWRHRIPTVSVLHDLRHLEEPDRYGQLQRRYRDVMYGHAIRNADRLVSISQSTANAALHEDPACGSRMLVARSGADHVLSWPSPTKRDHAIAFAQSPNKEPRIAISAWVQASVGMNSAPVIHVIGVPPAERASLEAYVSELHASEVVNLHARMDAAAFQAILASSALLVFPSSSEGLGIPVLEAMQLGIPVVASDLASIREAGGEFAWYAPPGDIGAFAARIREAMSPDPVRIEEGRLRASTFTWQACAEVLRTSLVLARSR